MGKKKIVEKGADSGADQPKAQVAPGGSQPRKKKSSRKVETGRIYIKSSYNNTMITVTDDKGDVLTWVTAGSTGFSGPKKATPFAASKVIASVAEKLDRTGPKVVDLYVSGVGPGRDSAIRSLASHGFEITSIREVTPIAHNGVRARKEKRN